MKVPAYIIFHRQSGKVLHVHIAPDELETSREALVAMAGSSHPSEELDIVVATAAQLRAGIAGEVDLETRQVLPATQEGLGFAGGLLGSNSAHQRTVRVPRVYKRTGGDE